MEKDTEKLRHEFDDMIEHMVSIGSAAKALVKAIYDNSELLEKQGGIEHIAGRSMILEKSEPKLHDKMKQQYTEAVTDTMKQVAEVIPLLNTMVTAFFRMPEDKKKFASKMN